MLNSDHMILCYTREPQEDMLYAKRLAYSMHLAYYDPNGNFVALNHNSGILFAKATENGDCTMNPKSLKSPCLFTLKDGGFGVAAVRVTAGGEPDNESKGKVLLFETDDLLQYREVGFLDLKADVFVTEITCEYNSAGRVYVLCWRDEQGRWHRNETKDIFVLNGASAPVDTGEVTLPVIGTGIEGAVPHNMISVTAEVEARLKQRLSTPKNTSIEVPETITASSPLELKNYKAKAVYSDGTAHEKTVDWFGSCANWAKPGVYTLKGSVHQDHYPFPVAYDRADPCIRKWKGHYYFIATNDADNNHTLYIRRADSITGLIGAKEVLLLDSFTYDDVKGLLWAPEFHIIKGELYIFFACTTGEFFYEESNVMKLRTGGDPLNRDDWSRPVRVVKKDGSYLCEAGKTISLDMTVIEGDEYYVAWSERQFLPVDIGAWIYIARIDPDEPWKLTSDPVLLTKPEYGWENNHTFVDEGPFVLKTDRHLFLTFSGAAVDATYVVGLLTADLNSDLLDPQSWTKCNYPLLTSQSVPGEFGPGHNAYVTDDNGDVWNSYHARPGVDGPRSTGLRRVHFDIDGYPVLDLTEEKDLNPALQMVSTKLIVK